MTGIISGVKEKDIGDIKKNPEEFAALVARELKENNIITDEEKAKQTILRGLPTIIRIAEKLWPENHDPEHLEKASNALYKGVEDPIHILKQAGIDIEPELEGFRQFLAEISGRKLKKPTHPAVKKRVEELSKAEKVDVIKLEAQKLLGLLHGLKLANYSESVVDNAKAELEKELDSLIENLESLELMGLYALVLRLIEKEEFEKAEKILKKL